MPSLRESSARSNRAGGESGFLRPKSLSNKPMSTLPDVKVRARESIPRPRVLLDRATVGINFQETYRLPAGETPACPLHLRAAKTAAYGLLGPMVRQGA